MRASEGKMFPAVDGAGSTQAGSQPTQSTANSYMGRLKAEDLSEEVSDFNKLNGASTSQLVLPKANSFTGHSVVQDAAPSKIEYSSLISNVADRFSWKAGTSKLTRLSYNHEERVSEDRSERGQPRILVSSVRLPQVSGTYSHGQAKENGPIKPVVALKQPTVEVNSMEKNGDRNETGDAMFLSVVKRPRMYPKLDHHMILISKQVASAQDGEPLPTNSVLQPAMTDELSFLKYQPDPDHRGGQPTQGPNQNKVRVSKSCPRPFTMERVPSVMNTSKLPIALSNLAQQAISTSGAGPTTTTQGIAQQLIEQHIIAPSLITPGFTKANHSVKLRTGVSSSLMAAHPISLTSSVVQQSLPPVDQAQGPEVVIKYMSQEELVEVTSPTACFKELEGSLSADKEWGSLFDSLNDLRSLVKFNEQLFMDNQPYLTSVFKKVCYLVVNKRSAVAKNALISLQEGIVKFGQQMQKLVGVFLQYLFTKMSDPNTFMLTEVEKCLQNIMTYTHPAKTLYILMGSADHKNQLIRVCVAKHFGKLFERIQKGIFFFKDYDRLIKILGTLSRDSCLEVRNHAKESTRVLSEHSDNPDTVLKAVMQPQISFAGGQAAPPSVQNSVLLRQATSGQIALNTDPGASAIRACASQIGGVSVPPDDRQSSPPPMAKKITIAVSGNLGGHQPYASALGPARNGVKLKRFSSNTLVALNRTEEFMKENPPISKRAKKAFIGEDNLPRVAAAEPGDESGPYVKVTREPQLPGPKNETILSRNRRPQLTAKNFPELDIIPDLMKDLQGEDWQGKVESLATAVAIIKEHSSKFMRSVHLPKFFDMLLELMQGSNQKMQIETLGTVKNDLRLMFKNLPERLLSLLVEGLFKLQGSNNVQVKTLAADCLINLKDYEDKSTRGLTLEVLQTTINRQYVNLSIKAKSNFAKYLADNASRLDESVMNLVHPVLSFNVCNANSELKRMNELLFRELYATYGDALLQIFDEKTKELVLALLQSCPTLPTPAAPQPPLSQQLPAPVS